MGAVALAAVAFLRFGSGTFFQEQIRCATYFEDDVNGLSVGAPVKFKGVHVGNVGVIDLPLDENIAATHILVRYDINATSLRGSADGPTAAQRIQRAIGEGLHARLATESFVTGVLYLSLEIVTDVGPSKQFAAEEGVIEIPALPSRQREFASFAASTMERLAQVPIEEAVEAMRDAARALDELLRSQAIQRTLAATEETLGSADRTLASVGALAESLRTDSHRVAENLDATLSVARDSFAQLDATLVSGERKIEDVGSAMRESIELLTASLRDTAASMMSATARLEMTLAAAEMVLDPQAPLVGTLRQTLEDLGQAARELGQLAEDVRRDPSVLLRGREAKGSSR